MQHFWEKYRKKIKFLNKNATITIFTRTNFNQYNKLRIFSMSKNVHNYFLQSIDTFWEFAKILLSRYSTHDYRYLIRHLPSYSRACEPHWPQLQYYVFRIINYILYTLLRTSKFWFFFCLARFLGLHVFEMLTFLT